MKNISTNFYTTLIAMPLFYAWIAFLCAILGIFYTPLVWGLWIVLCGFCFWKKWLVLSPPPREAHIPILLSIGFAATLFAIAEPSVFSGRDQGSISDAAFSLSRDHHLYASRDFGGDVVKPFFDIYGPGKAFNFPGFFYSNSGDLITQFPTPYIAFLAGFVSLFGVGGLLVANSILLFLVLVLVTTIARSVLSRADKTTRSHEIFYWGFIGLFFSSFATFHFPKYTLSENLAGVLFWASALVFLFIKKEVKTLYVYLFFLLVGLLFFTRIEGIYLLGIFAFLLYRSADFTSWASHNPWHRLWVPATLFGVVTVVTMIISTPFYKTLIKAFLPSGSGSSGESSSFLEAHSMFYTPTYFAYGLLIPLVFCALYVMISKKERFKSYLFLLIALCAPLFFYFIDPQISSDHPWMLRRFVWLLLPLTLLGMMAYFASLHKKYIALCVTFVVCFFFYGIWNWSPYFLFAENRDLLEQVEVFSKDFTSDDLILLDPHVTGDNWVMIDAPLRNLFEKHAVYFFNPADYANLDTSDFSRVFLVTPDDSTLFSELTDSLDVSDEFRFSTSRFDVEKRSHSFSGLPETEEVSIQNFIYRLK